MYDRLWRAWGPQQWWPGETPTEIAVGAILTQNTAWTNVERAIARLKGAGALAWHRLHALTESELADLIRSSGTFRVKARRLKELAGRVVRELDGCIEALADVDPSAARAWLLAVPGIGPETADAILLYALGRATFVVDAYTRRVLRRHGWINDSATYQDVQSLFHRAYLDDVDLKPVRTPREIPVARFFNEFHALIVAVGKRHCRSRARCAGCPLADLPHDEAR